MLHSYETCLANRSNESDHSSCAERERIAMLAEQKLDSQFSQRRREPSLHYVLLQSALLLRAIDGLELATPSDATQLDENQLPVDMHHSEPPPPYDAQNQFAVFVHANWDALRAFWGQLHIPIAAISCCQEWTVCRRLSQISKSRVGEHLTGGGHYLLMCGNLGSLEMYSCIYVYGAPARSELAS